MTATNDIEPTPGRDSEAAPEVDPAGVDRLTRLLRLLAAGLLVVVLVFALVFVIYLKGLGAPRSAAERDIAAYRAAVAAQPEILTNHVKLAYAYALGGRYDEALEAIDRAEQMTPDPQAQVQLAYADILRAAGRFDEAVPAYDTAARLADQEHEAAKAKRAKSRIFVEIPNELLANALHGRSTAKWETGDRPGAITDLAAAIEIIPTDAAMLVTLAGFQAESGDSASAAASYRKALKFVPDYAQAIEGLRTLEEGP